MWPYDDYTWWVDAIHYATCPYMRRPACFSRSSGCAPSLEELNSTWDAALSVLRTGEQPVDSAACFLFRHKALRKWKFAPVSLARARRREAIAGFLARNKSSHLEEPIPYPYSVWMREVLREWLPRPQCMDRVTGRFGPGACAEHYTHAERMLHLSRWAAQNNAHWPEVPNLRERLTDHETARLCAVPKQYDKDRLITVEPCYATFVQQAARQYILQSIHEGPLAGSCMDLGYTDGQSIQRRHALRASRKKALATLDLKDASDRIGWLHVQQVFPPHILDWLWQARSTRFEYSVDDSVGERAPCQNVEPLRIYAGMGNATTFPVETLFFAAFVYAYARAHGLRTYASVFGDDVICHSDTARRLVKEDFPFFVVNPLKSFWGDDELRESCGIFAYQGNDITVPKVDGYPNTWDGRLGLCELHDLLVHGNQSWMSRLASCIAGTGQLVNWPVRLPGYPSIQNEWEAAVAGWSLLPEVRWNRRLHRLEYKVPIRRQRYKSYPLDWKRAKAINAPRPEEWLPSILLDQVSTPSCRVDHPEARVGCSSVRFPLEGSYDISPQWVSPLG